MPIFYTVRISFASYSDPESRKYIGLICHEAVELLAGDGGFLSLGEGYSDQNTFNIFCGAWTDRWETGKERRRRVSLPIQMQFSSVYPFSLVIRDHTAAFR